MQRQHGELVPIGEVVSGLDDVLVPAIPSASPQTRHSFTVADQVNQLVAASEADPDRGFMARMMALCSLPRSNPGNRLQYKRVNGPYTLAMTAGVNNKLPFGNFPRLILAWVSTEAVRTQSRGLVLGRSLAEFMRALGIYNSGGQPQTRLRNQMDRLFHVSVQLIYEDEGAKAGISSFVADRTEFWWNKRKPNESSLWGEQNLSGGAVFQRDHPQPRTARPEHPYGPQALLPGSRSLPVAETYRTFALRAPLRLTWQHLYHQFDADPSKAGNHDTVQYFRRKVLRELKKIKLAWPGLNYATAPGGHCHV